MARWHSEAETPSRMQMFASFHPDEVFYVTGLLHGIREPVECHFAVDAKAEVIHARLVRFAQHDTVMVVFVPCLQIDAPLRVAASFMQAKHVDVVLQRRTDFEDPQRNMAGSQYALQCHDVSP